MVEEQSLDIALGVDNGGAGDQGIMYGYATNETEELLPLPYVLATEFLKELHRSNNHLLKDDTKAQVSFDYDSNRITTFLCRVQQEEWTDISEIKYIVEK